MMDIDELIDYVDEVFDSALAKKARAELTTLRAELEQERELADRLAGAIDSAEFDYGKWDTEDARMMDDAVALYATRRNK